MDNFMRKFLFSFGRFLGVLFFVHTVHSASHVNSELSSVTFEERIQAKIDQGFNQDSARSLLVFEDSLACAPSSFKLPKNEYGLFSDLVKFSQKLHLSGIDLSNQISSVKPEEAAKIMTLMQILMTTLEDRYNLVTYAMSLANGNVLNDPQYERSKAIFANANCVKTAFLGSVFSGIEREYSSISLSTSQRGTLSNIQTWEVMLQQFILLNLEKTTFTEENLYAGQEFDEPQRTSIRAAFSGMREATPEKLADPIFTNAMQRFVTHRLNPDQIAATVIGLDMSSEKLKTVGFISCLDKLYEEEIVRMKMNQIGAIFMSLLAIEDVSVFGRPEFSTKLAKLVTSKTEPGDINSRIANLVILTRGEILKSGASV